MTVIVTKRLRKVHKYDLSLKPPKKQIQYIAFAQHDVWYMGGVFDRKSRVSITHNIFAKIVRILKSRGRETMYVLDILVDDISPKVDKYDNKYSGIMRYRPWVLTGMKSKIYNADQLPLKYFTLALGCSIEI